METRPEKHWWSHARCYHRLRRLVGDAGATTYARSVLAHATWEPARLRLARLIQKDPPRDHTSPAPRA